MSAETRSGLGMIFTIVVVVVLVLGGGLLWWYPDLLTIFWPPLNS